MKMVIETFHNIGQQPREEQDSYSTLKWKGACKGTNIGEEGLAQIKVGFSESLGAGTDKYEKEDEELKTAYKRTRRL